MLAMFPGKSDDLKYSCMYTPVAKNGFITADNYYCAAFSEGVDAVAVFAPPPPPSHLDPLHACRWVTGHIPGACRRLVRVPKPHLALFT